MSDCKVLLDKFNRAIKTMENMVVYDLILSIETAYQLNKELLAFDTFDNENLMPYSGTFIRMAERQYLLFNNTRYNPNSKITDKEYHFPIKIKLTSTHCKQILYTYNHSSKYYFK